MCPISTKLVNEYTSRLNASVSFFLSLGYIMSSNYIFLILLLSDFILRNINEGKLSPVLILNNYLTRSFIKKIQLINAGPKILAARIGLYMTVLALILSLFSVNYSIAVILLLGTFSLLESAFGFCIACKLYPFLKLFGENINKKTQR